MYDVLQYRGICTPVIFMDIKKICQQDTMFIDFDTIEAIPLQRTDASLYAARLNHPIPRIPDQ
mgnify:CR=1 FL=1